MVNLLRTLALAVGLAVVAVACGGDGDGDGDRDFTATSLDGEEVALADYAGEDVMLWFWAPW